MTPPLAPDSVHPGEKSSRYVALLFIVSTVSLMDRDILAILLEPIKRELGASDTEMGLLTGSPSRCSSRSRAFRSPALPIGTHGATSLPSG